MARRPVPPQGDVVLTDASAVRALAHPARLAVIDALYSGEVLTATQCAAIVGITPSAMSYHLRALEKHGIVVRADVSGDGRERPWMRAGDRLSTSLPHRAGKGAAAATGLMVDQSLALDNERLRRAMAADLDAADETWRRTTTYSRDLLVLTPDEARALRESIEAAVEPYLADKRRGRRPTGASTFGFSVILARDPDD